MAVAQGAARYSRVRGGGVDVCCQGWRGVVSGGIVSHPSRQQSGGVRTRERPYRGCNGRCSSLVYEGDIMRRCIRSEYGSRARNGAASVEWWSSGVVRGDGRMASLKISAG